MILVFAESRRANNPMNRGFNTILAAQFFSSLGDNVLLFAAIAQLKSRDALSRQTPIFRLRLYRVHALCRPQWTIAWS
jgi:hypothetical protein